MKPTAICLHLLVKRLENLNQTNTDGRQLCTNRHWCGWIRRSHQLQIWRIINSTPLQLTGDWYQTQKLFRIFYLCLILLDADNQNALIREIRWIISVYNNDKPADYSPCWDPLFHLKQNSSSLNSFTLYCSTTNLLKNLTSSLEKEASKWWKRPNMPFSVSQISSDNKRSFGFSFQAQASKNPLNPYLSPPCASNAKWVSSQRIGNPTFQILIQTTIFLRIPTSKETVHCPIRSHWNILNIETVWILLTSKQSEQMLKLH